MVRGILFQETIMTNENLPKSNTSLIDAPLGETVTFFAPPWVRLGARLFASSLDSKLAVGVHPATNNLLAARAQRLDRARNVGSLAARARIRLRAVRQWRLCRFAACHRARALG